MADTNVRIPNLPEHVEETVRSIGQLHADHHENATLLDRALEHFPKRLNRDSHEGANMIQASCWGGGQHEWRSHIRAICAPA